MATTAKCCFLRGSPLCYLRKQSWELHPAAEASLGPHNSWWDIPGPSPCPGGAFQGHHTIPGGAFQGHHTVLVGNSRGIAQFLVVFWGGGCYSGSSGADGSVPTAGCTFEEDSDPNQCEYSQGEDDDFDWELIRSYLMPHLTPDLPHGESWGPRVSGSRCPYLSSVSCTPGLDYVAPHGLIPAMF